MSTAVLTDDGARRLDGRADAPVTITAQDVTDPEKLARLLNDLRRDVAEERRRWKPSEIYRQDLSVTGGDTISIAHGLHGRVRYAVVEWEPDTPGDAPLFDKDDSTDEDTLRLAVGNSGTVTLHVWEAG